MVRAMPRALRNGGRQPQVLSQAQKTRLLRAVEARESAFVEADDRYVETLLGLRDEGASLAAISDALGCTRQAVSLFLTTRGRPWGRS